MRPTTAPVTKVIANRAIFRSITDPSGEQYSR
jgi:hypothetical protein